MVFPIAIVLFLVSTAISILLAPKPPRPAAATLADFDFPTAEEGRPIPVVFGTRYVTGPNVLWYGDLSSKAIRKKSGFSSATVGYKYYVGLHIAICHGPVDEVSRIDFGGKNGYTGSVTGTSTITVFAPGLFGGNKREGGVQGKVSFLFGDAAQTRNTYLDNHLPSGLVGPTPTFRGIVSAAFYGGRSTGSGPLGDILPGTTGGFYVGNTPYPKAIAFLVTRIMEGWADGVWYGAKAQIGDSMNGAHIVYECLTNPDWGMGADATEIDDTVFRAAADTLYDEDFGLSIIWNGQESIEDFLQKVVSHLGGSLLYNLETGKYEFRLIRQDYDVGDLNSYDEDIIKEMKVFDRAGLGASVSQITLRYTDPDTRKPASITHHDLATADSQGAVIGETIEYPGITDHDVAAAVLAREVTLKQTPIARVKFTATRQWREQNGDVFLMNWAERGVVDTPFRVINVDLGTLQEGLVTVDAVEDAFASGGRSYLTPPAANPTLPDVTPPDDQPNPEAAVISSTQPGPPASPLDGDTYLVPAGATGPWTGHTGELATWDEQEGEWEFSTPPQNQPIFDQDAGVAVIAVGTSILPNPYSPAIPPLTADTTPTLTDLDVLAYDTSISQYVKVPAELLAPSGLLTAKGDLLSHDGTAAAKLAVGTNDYVLTADSTAAKGIAWKAPAAASPLTTKGDIYTRDASVNQRLPVGTNGQFLKADSAESTGLKWVTVTPGGSPLTTKGDLYAHDGSTDVAVPVGTDGYVLTADSGAAEGVSWQPASGGGSTEGWVTALDAIPGSPNAMDDEFNDNSFDTTKWTWLNQGGATVQENSGSLNHLILHTPASAGDNYRMIYQTLPGGTWKFRAKTFSTITNSNFAHAGIFVRNSANGKFYAFGHLYASGRGILVQAMNGFASYSATPYSNFTNIDFDSYMYLDIEYNGTNLIFSWAQVVLSTLAKNPFISTTPTFTTALTVTPATFLGATPNQIGIQGDSNNSNIVDTYVDFFRRLS
jgi:hypothetical protein